MKGVILGICPEARVVDLTHGIPPHDILAACLALEAAHSYFPSGTIHVAVVDPGVGTDRAPVAVRTAEQIFVAPDNGLLTFLPSEAILEVRRLDNPRLRLHPVSATFHGRDVFAPAAGHLAAGTPFAELGPRQERLVRLAWPHPQPTPGGVRGEVLAFDRFGNAVTNLRPTDLPPSPRCVEVAGRTLAFAGTYGEVPSGTPLALIGSGGRVEISVREGSAREALGLVRGTPLEVRS
ncbi:MAG: SAM-dependent chlorinase/fluorinase [Deferrisomatales bacterium]